MQVGLDNNEAERKLQTLQQPDPTERQIREEAVKTERERQKKALGLGNVGFQHTARAMMSRQ